MAHGYPASSTEEESARTRPLARAVVWLSVMVLPMWVAAFVGLVALTGPGGPPSTPSTAAEAAGLYSGVSTVGWIVWTLYSSLVLVLNGWCVWRISSAVDDRGTSSAAAPISAVAAGCALVYAIVTAWLTIGLKLAEPPVYPPLVESLAIPIENAKAWSAPLTYALLCAATGAVAVSLRRAGIIGRLGLGIAVLAGVFVVLSVAVPVPILPAVLLCALGLALLRSDRARGA